MKPDTIRARDQLNGWLLIAPALLLLLLVFAYPIGRAFWLSLFAQNLGTQLQPVFSGFDNYVRMANDQYGVWNDILLRLGLIKTGFNWLGEPGWAMLTIIAAGTVLGTLPLILLVLFFQRKIVQGLTAGAIKG